MSDIKLACDVVEQVRAICDKHGNQPGELINITSWKRSICTAICRKRCAPDCCKAECSGVACVWCGNILYFLYDDS